MPGAMEQARPGGADADLPFGPVGVSIMAVPVSDQPTGGVDGAPAGPRG